ncbi:hypothetical protein ES708_30711 [subsurface metagenome]
MIDTYGEVDFGKFVTIDQWRHHGESGEEEDGEWKLEYKDINGDWQEWVTGIPTRLDNWSTMSVEAEVITSAIRLICVAVDTQAFGYSRCKELEVYHS